MSNTFTEPTWGTPEPYVESSCFSSSAKPDIIEIIAICRRVVEAHFADADNIRNRYLAENVLVDSIESPVKVRLGYTEDLKEAPSGRLDVYIIRGECRFQNLSPFRNVTVRIGNAESSDVQNLTGRVEAPLTILCSTANAVHSDMAAQEISDLFMYFSWVMENEFHLFEVQPVGIGPVQEKREQGKRVFYVTPLSVKISVVRSWQVHTETVY